MYCDVVLMEKNSELEKFAQKLGFSQLFFKEDFQKLGLVLSKDYLINRTLVDSGKLTVLVDPHVNPLKDSFTFRVGGLDEALCKSLSKNNVALGISLSSLTNPVLLGRVKQNIFLCRKFHVRMFFFSFATTKYSLKCTSDLLSLLKVLGMTGKEAKDALRFCDFFCSKEKGL